MIHMYDVSTCNTIQYNRPRSDKKVSKANEPNVTAVLNKVTDFFYQLAMQTKRITVHVANSTPVLRRQRYVNLNGFHARRLILFKIRIHVRNNMRN